MPLPPIPFAPPRIYDPTPSGVRIADLIMRQGDIAARGAAASGQIWGNAVQQLGQIGAQAYEQHQQEKVRKQREAAFTQAMTTWDSTDPRGSIMRLAKVIGPDAIKFGEGMMTFESMIEKNKKAEIPTQDETLKSLKSAGILWKNAPGLFNQSYPQLRQQFGPAIKAHWAMDLPEQPTPEIEKALSALATEPAKPPADFSLGPGQVRFNAAGQQVAAVPATEKPLTHVNLGDRVEFYDAAGKLVKTERVGLTPSRAPAPQPPEDLTLNPEGVVLSSYGVKQKNQARQQAKENGLPIFETAAAQQKAIVYRDIHADATELKGLLELPEVKDAVGGIAGNWTQLKGRFFELPPNVRRAFQLMNSLSDSELRKRSGAQISVQEMNRMLRFTTDPTRPLDHNTTAVNGLLESSRRDYRSLSGIDPDKAESGAGVFSVTAPNGKTYSFENAAQLDAFKKRAGIP